MEPIGPGDYVECVNDGPGTNGRLLSGEERLVLSAVYVVQDCFLGPGKIPSVGLVGKDRKRGSALWGQRVGYGVWRFRKIYRPKTSLLKSLLQPVSLEEERAS